MKHKIHKIRHCCSKKNNSRNKNKNTRSCIRKKDNKVFSLPRKFTRKQCKNPRGFSMRSSCAPYKFCKYSSSKSRRKRRR